MALVARRPIQLLATEWAPKKPNVKTSMPKMTSGNGVNMVRARPQIISAIVLQSTLRRPILSASEPIFAEL
ncbi:hypothetical protein D3C78_1900170 [compost metagenome]